MKKIQIRREDSGEITILSLEGELSAEWVPQFQDYLHDLIEENRVKIVLDLTRVDYIGSSGLSTLLTVAGELKRKGGGLALAGAQPLAREAMEIFGLLKLVNAYDTVEEAKAEFSSP